MFFIERNHKNINMSEDSLSSQFEQKKSDYDRYLNKSKKICLMATVFQFFLVISMAIFVISSILGYKPPSIFNPSYTLDYIFATFAVSLFFISIISIIIVDFYRNHIKKLFNYESINVPFITMYQSHLYLEKYLADRKEINKLEFKNHINYSFKIINNWRYGNIPFIKNMFKEKFDFIINNFKPMLFNLTKSDEPSNNHLAALELISKFYNFLY